MLSPTSLLFTFILPVIKSVLPITIVVVNMHDPKSAPRVISSPLLLLFTAIIDVEISGAPFARASSVTPVNYSLSLKYLVNCSRAGVR